MDMRHSVKKFKSMKGALKELEPFIKNGTHLSSGRPFRRFDDMRSREILANWMICAAYNRDHGADWLTFTSDPTGGDGILHNTKTGESWRTEHVMVPKAKPGETSDIETLIADQVKLKQNKGGTAYASGKTLVIFLDAGLGNWSPNRAARQLPSCDFNDVWIVGLQSVAQGAHLYAVTKLELVEGNAPVWNVQIPASFDDWTVWRRQ